MSDWEEIAEQTSNAKRILNYDNGRDCKGTRTLTTALGTNRVLRAVATLESLHEVHHDETEFTDGLRFSPPDGLVRLAFKDVVLTPATVLGSCDFHSSGHHTGRLVNGKPVSLVEVTGGEGLSIVQPRGQGLGNSSGFSRLELIP